MKWFWEKEDGFSLEFLLLECYRWNEVIKEEIWVILVIRVTFTMSFASK